MKVYMYGTNSLVNSTEDSLMLNQKIRIYRRFDNVLKGTYYPIFTLSSNKVKIENIQIELNTVATDYVEHKEQTFTFPLGNEKLMLGDYLADDGIHHVRGQVVLDGSKNINWIINSLATHYNFYAQVVSNCKARQLITCSHSSSNSFDDTLNNCYISATKNFNFNFSIDGVTTSNAFNNWLSTHNTVVEYELQEEVIVPYTSAQQEVYNQIKQAISYEEQTNISSNTIALFNVEAYQDIKEKIEEAGGHTHNNKAVLDGISSADITRWNNKSDFSGNYNDLTNKPTIPVVPTNVSAFTNDVGYLTEHQDISGKLDTSKVKNSNSTTAGDVYDVRYINTMIGDVETVLTRLTTGSGV